MIKIWQTFPFEQFLPKQKTRTEECEDPNLVREIIAHAIREGKFLNYDDPNEQKWFCVFVKQASGFVLSASGYDYSNTRTRVGSRLCFPSQELSDYFGGPKFIKYHNNVLLTPTK